jgi:RNA polymerase sigma factor (sigma-70 family)
VIFEIGLPFGINGINIMSHLESDENLLKSIASGDSSAFKVLYRKHYLMVKSLVVENNGNMDDASDVFQETMIIIYEKIRDGKLTLTASLKTFIYSIARNLWFKKLREKKSQINIKDLEQFITVEEEEQPAFDNDKIKVLLNEIGETCKQLLVLYYYRKLSMQEICLKLNYANADTVKTQKYKCLQRIKRMVSI